MSVADGLGGLRTGRSHHGDGRARDLSNRGLWRFVRVLGEARWRYRWSDRSICATLPAPRAPQCQSQAFFRNTDLSMKLPCSVLQSTS